jgi:hypothetical protein
MYLFGVWFIHNFVLVFILTLLLLSIDFYYLKNIAGRRLVGLRWWNEVNTATGDSHWVFESLPSEDAGGRKINATDKRFFWLSMYIAPVLWVLLGVLAVVRLLSPIWLVIVGECLCWERRCGVLYFTDCYYSVGTGSDHYQYGGIFEMRQVQSSNEFCWRCLFRRRNRKDSRREHGREVLQVDLRTCVTV